jgi:ribosomal protein L37AE/L43A
MKGELFLIIRPLCPICGLEAKTVGHIIWSCPSSKDVLAECAQQEDSEKL